MKIELPKWYDLHVHLRQGGAMESFIKAQISMGCAGVLAMPNTSPPVTKVFESDLAEGWSIESYAGMIRKAGGNAFLDFIVPLYLCGKTTPEMIENGAKKNILRACKYYPPHGTTGAQSAAPLETYIDNGVFAAMEKAGVVLCIHGEEHGLSGENYFGRESNAEETFYKKRMPELVRKFPKLKIVCEHITTKAAADFVQKSGPNITATITPQHLLYTTGDMVQGFKYHLYCLPLLKFDRDREALRAAATSEKNTKFFAGTDSAPHVKKATECGCAAGCFTGGYAPQLYAQGFEAAGLNFSDGNAQEIFKRFLCTNGPAFYGLPAPKETFTLEKKEQSVTPLQTPDGAVTPLPLGMGSSVIPWSIKA